MKLLLILGLAFAEAGKGLTKEQIQEGIKKKLPEVAKCAPEKLPSVTISVGFRINAKGEVSEVEITQPGTATLGVHDCVLGAVKTMSFEKPKGGVTVDVEYPFTIGNIKKGFSGMAACGGARGEKTKVKKKYQKISPE